MAGRFSKKIKFIFPSIFMFAFVWLALNSQAASVRFVTQQESVKISDEKKQELLNQAPQGDIEKVSGDIKELVPQKDLLELFCLQTKAKSSDFFAALYALESVLAPAINDMSKIGMDVSGVPSIDAYSSEGWAKLNAVCEAKNFAEAQSAADDLKEFGQKTKKELVDLRSNLAKDLKAKGEEFKKETETKIKSEVDEWVKQEKDKARNELDQLAEQLSEQAKNNLTQEMQAKEFSSEDEAKAYAQSRAGQIKAEITAKINKLAEEKQNKIEEEANKKAEELLGGDADKFKDIAKKMENLEGDIKKLMSQKGKEYQQYKVEAAKKRQELILKVIDESIAEGRKKLEEKNEMMKKNGLQAGNLDGYIKSFQEDKKDLVTKIEQAIANDDFDSINVIVYEMQEKWKRRVGAINNDFIQRYPPKTICGITMQQIINYDKPELKVKYAVYRIGQALNKNIGWAKGKCQSLNLPSDDPVCRKVEKLEKELMEAKNKANAFLAQIQQVKEKCSQVTDSTKPEEIMDDLIAFRNKGRAYKDEMDLLEKQYEKEINEIYSLIRKDHDKYKL